MEKPIGAATFALTLWLALWGHRQEAIDEPARNLVNSRVVRSLRSAEQQQVAASGFREIERLRRTLGIEIDGRAPNAAAAILK